MIIRSLALCVVFLTNAFAQTAALVPFSLRPNELSNSGGFAQKTALDNAGFDSNYKLSLPRPVQDKNFYFLSLLQRSPEARALLHNNPTLRLLAANKVVALKKTASCDNVGCFDELLKFDRTQIEEVASVFRRLADEPAFRRLMKKDLRPSGVFIKYARQSDAELLAAAWQDAANGMNRIIRVYALGINPRYPAIDKLSFEPATDAYRDLLKAKSREIDVGSESLFFEPTLNFALKLLAVNKRDEPARYEPLEAGENRAAVQNLKNIRWSDYPYSFILVLGSGPADSARLSPIGAKRSDVGAQLFLQRKAPLIILSGGHVHPMLTPYCEAIEMKKYVMEKYKIPEANILVDPYARHTTTNFRNAARLAFRYRIPTELALVTSTESHIASSSGDDFRKRCVTELGYFPMEFIKQIAPDQAEFKPSVVSLFFDANDPLDP